jgi:zinc-binding alcohol dehydrogenase family protein
MSRMKAVGLFKTAADDIGELRDIETPKPRPAGQDLLVRVKAAAVNPVDVKTRRRVSPELGQPVILGFDASGTVEALGPLVRDFDVGDDVYYAGSIVRPGAYAEYQLVDARLAARKPTRLSHVEAAALPLTSITAWEMLFARLGIVEREGGEALLLLGGAGGVGSMAIQLARRLTDLVVIAAASRPDGQAWCRRLGAQHVIDHRGDLASQTAAVAGGAVRYAFAIVGADAHWDALAQLIAPQGRVGLIDDPEPVDLRVFKAKSVSLHWENMFTRSVFQTPDMAEQGRLLGRIADLVDGGALVTTLGHDLGALSAAALDAAHRRIVSDHPPGKLVFQVA